MAKQQTRVALTERAVVQRINRKLESDQEAIRKHRSGQNAGDYYHVDLNRNVLLAETIDLERFARECGAIEEWEYLAEDAVGVAGPTDSEKLLAMAQREEAKAAKAKARAAALREMARNSRAFQVAMGRKPRPKKTAGGESGG
jgi:hypothetical protein